MNGMAGRPVIFGEVLFDTFPDGHAVLGGAPFNVAWHLAGFGLDPLFISCIGEDAPGREVLRVMAEWGMDTSGLQVNRTKPTGKVEVTIKDGEPHFTILADQAYDYIDAATVKDVLAGVQASLIYHGSLISRAPASRRALAAAVQTSQVPVFVDVNLRPPWWRREDVETMLGVATWAKLNEDELLQLGGDAGADEDARINAAAAFCARFGLVALIVTMGEAGALFVTDAGESGFAKAEPVRGFQDSVGAGDAFAAVTIFGLERGWGWPLILKRAQAFAAAICSLRGATIHDPALYQGFLARWKEGA